MSETKAGLDLDLRIAKDVLGLLLEERVTPRHAHAHEGDEHRRWFVAHPDVVVAGDPFFPLPDYSEDIGSAWAVVALFDTAEVKRWRRHDRPGFFWTAELTRYEPEGYGFSPDCDTAEVAICLAALAAVRGATEGERA